MTYEVNIEDATFIQSLHAFCMIVEIEKRTAVDALYAALACAMSRKRFDQVVRASIATGLVTETAGILSWKQS